MQSASKLIELFPPELRTASIVPRWSVVWTLNKDTVANHSFYVAIYARQIARVIGWRADIATDLLMFLALTHDLDETITGDIVSPVKEAILDEGRANDYIGTKMLERLPALATELALIERDVATTVLDECWSIIRVADRLDALLFLLGEQRMGNGVIAPRIPSAEARLYSAFMELPKVRQELDALWNTVMTRVIAAHRSEGGHGV